MRQARKLEIFNFIDDLRQIMGLPMGDREWTVYSLACRKILRGLFAFISGI